jgi:hypothetical protein
MTFADEAHIWKLDDGSGEITGWWENRDHSIVPVWYAYNPQVNIIVIVGNMNAYLHEHPGWYQVVSWTSSVCNLTHLGFQRMYLTN